MCSPALGKSFEVSPEGGRTRRRSTRRNDHCSDDGATVISTTSSVAPGGTTSSKKKGPVKDGPKKTKSTRNLSIRHDDNEMSIQPNLSNTLCSQTSPLTRPGNRVSVSPFDASDNASLPEFHGNDQQKLQACLDALKSSHETDRPTFSSDSNSKFTANLRAVSDFLQAAMKSQGEHGGRLGEPAALFVCGAPGTGKTSGVKWCCETAVNSWGSEGPVTAAICHINAGHLISEPDPWQCVLGEIRVHLGIKTETPKLATIEQKMKRNEDDPKGTFLVVVVDEVDSLVSSRTSDVENCNVRREKCLQTLLEWAKDPDKQMAFIGISNCANDERTIRIHEVGAVSSLPSVSLYILLSTDSLFSSFFSSKGL